MSIVVPKRFKNKLLPWALYIINDQNEGIANYFETTPYYFEEYTIHGMHHINAVLEYADKLIPKNTFKKLSSSDISILVLGICLHDLGMYIKESGLRYLFSIEEKYIKDDKSGNYVTWKEAWDKHLSNLKRASGKEIDNLFGNNEPIFDISSRQVCSSFIRKHHHEIAYYIAVNGFPGEISHDILAGIGENEKRLIGLLAKSHGVPLRSLNEEINQFGYCNNLPLNAPIYYLMALLRLSDLLDADENRAPRILSDMNVFYSARSKNEWILNQLITDKQWPEQMERPETLNIIAKPKNSNQYIELKSWFEYWQKELDLSWAVIGEKHKKKYELAIRRITSNIYERQYEFVTDAVSLSVNPDIVKLLVAPLYGDDPSYGVRELLQNAVDACNERTIIDGTIGQIFVEVDKSKKIFRISDNGIGMSEDVIANYYLKAGASYRYSKQWTDQFMDEQKNTKVARNGRFGIGALATFLIGNKAKVITRHIDDQMGYCFEYTIEPEVLNIKRVEKKTPGTTIEIKIKDQAINEFRSWYYSDWTGWYHLTTPNITYILDKTVLQQDKIYDLKKGKDTDGWFYCDMNDYESLHWTVSHYIPGSFICNGIHIPNEKYYYGDSPYRRSLKQRGYYDIEPDIAVIDKKGIFPIDLARKTVFDSFYLDDVVVNELCKYRIAKLLVKGEKDKNCLFNNNGFIPKERSFILNTNIPVYLVGKADSTFESLSGLENKINIAVGFFEANKKVYSKNINNEVTGDDLLNKSVVTEIWANPSIIQIPKTVNYLPDRKYIHFIDDSNDWENNLPVAQNIVQENVNLVIKYVPSPIRKDENNIMFNLVKELLPNDINGGFIPYDLKERKKLYNSTFKKLERYISYIESGNKK